jgi:hypothetical protein
MSIIRILLILFVIFLFSIIVYNLLQKRKIILQKIENENNNNSIESFFGYELPKFTHIMDNFNQMIGNKSNSTIEYEPDVSSKIKFIMLNNNDPKLKINISNVSNNENYLSLPLHQLYIKSSFNSALINNNINSNMVKYILTRGCRMLDFELYYLTDPNDKTSKPNAYVGYNSYNDAVNSSTQNVVPFNQMMKQILDFAFSHQFWKVNKNEQTFTCPNPEDPLFIQLRIKTTDMNKMNLYTIINETINDLYCDNSYKNNFLLMNNEQKINLNSQLKIILNKIIFVFQYDDYIANNNANFYNNLLKLDLNKCKHTEKGYFAYIIVNNGSLNQRYYSNINTQKFIATPPVIKGINEINTDQWFIVRPDENSINNVDTYSGIINYGYQIHMMQYDKNDMFLQRNEQMHNTFGSAFIPMGMVVRYVEGINGVYK